MKKVLNRTKVDRYRSIIGKVKKKRSQKMKYFLFLLYNQALCRQAICYYRAPRNSRLTEENRRRRKREEKKGRGMCECV